MEWSGVLMNSFRIGKGRRARDLHSVIQYLTFDGFVAFMHA